MVPRISKRKERDNDFSAVGKIGRRTGVTLPVGRLDENGIEEVSGIFSSPRKASPSPYNTRTLGTVTENGTGLNAKQVVSTRKSLRGPSLPPPRSASPRKTGISGNARRSIVLNSFSPAKSLPAFDPGDRENSSIPTPSRAQSNSVRRFSPSLEKSPLQDITASQSTRDQGRRRVLSLANDFDRELGEYETSGTTDANRQAETELSAAVGYPDDEYVDVAANGEDNEPGLVNKHSVYEEDDVPLRPLFDDEEVDQTFEPEDDAPVDDHTPTKANSRKKRKSDILTDGLGSLLSLEHPTKKARPNTKQSSLRSPNQVSENIVRQDSPAQDSPTSLAQQKTKQKPRVGRPRKDAALSTRQESQLREIIEKVKARPGKPKSLYILRRETPADDSATHTRSGRVSVKPLAYWRNERCVYSEASPGHAGLKDGARFPLNSIKEIIRTEDVTAPVKPRSKKRSNRATSRAHSRAGSRARSQSRGAYASDSDEDEEYLDPDAEPWETATGIFRGPISVWNQSHQAVLETQETVDLAYAPAAIPTREVPNSSFKYAKLLSYSFFGAGIVDLPPGGVKRPKNSRKMHMSFFVAKGRVMVQVGPMGSSESRFSVGKGGFWQVPRGNQYSIENDTEKPARIFFSQGCEPLPQDED